MPINNTSNLKNPDYNPNYFPLSCDKPLIIPDSSGEYIIQTYNGWGNKYFCTTSNINNGVPEHLIQTHNRISDKDYYVSNSVFVLSIIMLFVLASIRIFYAKALWGLGKALFNYQWAIKAYEERNSLLERVYLMLDGLFIINSTISIYLLLSYFFDDLKYSIYEHIGISFAFVAIVYFSRIIIIWFIAAITKQVKLAGEFIMITNMYYKAGGILLFLPILLFNYISDFAVPYLSLFIVLILFTAYIYTIIRGLQFAIKRKFYFYYYFLYLCAVEIMPLLLTTKMFMLTKGI